MKLEGARKERQHQEECELIRQQVAAQPSRQHTMGEIAQLEADVEALERDNVAAGKLLELRRKQFALLLHTVRVEVEAGRHTRSERTSAGKETDCLRLVSYAF